jgi:hypothetical protein
MPLVSKTFDQLLDFTRTTAATFVGSNGLIQNTPASVNLLLQTQQFDNAAWTKSNATVSANAAVAPDGTSTADKLVEDTVNLTHEARQLVAVSAAPHTYSVYLKAGERSFAMLFVNTLNVGTVFDLSNGTTAGNAGFTAPTAASITSVGNGWYRCSITTTTTAASLSFRVYIMQNSTTYSYTGDGTSGIFLWGAQLEVGSTATTYTRNNGGVYPPRFDYDPVTLAPKGILIEEQRTNLITYSETPTDSVWQKSNVTVSGNLVTATASTASHRLIRDGISSPGNFIFWVEATAGTQRYIQLYNGASTNMFANFDLVAGTVGTVGSLATASITALGGGRFRCAMVINIANSPNATHFVGMVTGPTAAWAQSWTATGTENFTLHLAQLEVGAFPTSYIPTVASQVTRTADQCSIVAPNFAPWYNQSEGTFVVEATVPTDVDGALGNYYLAASDGTNANQILLAEVNGTVGQIQTSNVLEFNSKVGVEPTGIVKAALAYKTNDVILCVGGTLGTLDTSVPLPTVNRLSIGIRGDNSASTPLNGHIRSIRYYPVRLSDAQLQALTA